MSLTSILSVEPHPERALDYQMAIADLAAKAREQNEAFKWTAHEVAYGGPAEISYVSRADDFAGLALRGLPLDMVRRVLGDEQSAKAMTVIGSCTRQSRTAISVDRPDLSYLPDDPDTPPKFAAVTLISARSGHVEACEELIRKVAEAIPKVGDPARMVAYQNVVGDLSQYWTVRGLDDLSDLDAHLPPPELLNQAFGPAEGGLIFRAGLDAIEHIERRIVILNEDLSNPG
jgi:hypothetical protein